MNTLLTPVIWMGWTLKKGEVVGQVVLIMSEGTDYGYVTGASNTSDVVTNEAVKRVGWFTLGMQAIDHFFANLRNGATVFVGGLL